MKSCAIVILNYNGGEILPTFLPSVLSESSNDIWVIDNASTDESLALLEAEFPEVKLIRLKENFGFAGGYNWGLEQIKGQYENYILLNSDVEVTACWDQQLIDWLQENSDYVAVQPKILSWVNRTEFDYAGAGGGYLDSLGYPYCRGRIWNSIEKDSGQYDDAIEVDWSSGACMAVRASSFHKMEGFDAHFFAHMEEIDLCWRMRSKGLKIGYLGMVSVYHLGGATLKRTSPNKLYLNIRNSLAMLYKNQSGFWFSFFLKGLMESLAALGYFLSGQSALGKAITNGYRDFLARRKLFVRSHAGKTSKSIGPSPFILWAYFIRKKKIFTEL